MKRGTFLFFCNLRSGLGMLFTKRNENRAWSQVRIFEPFWTGAFAFVWNRKSRWQIDIDINSYIQPHSEVRTRWSHRYRDRQDKAIKNIYFYSFFSRTIRLWNILPMEIVESNLTLNYSPTWLRITYTFMFFTLYYDSLIFIYVSSEFIY